MCSCTSLTARGQVPRALQNYIIFAISTVTWWQQERDVSHCGTISRDVQELQTEQVLSKWWLHA